MKKAFAYMIVGALGATALMMCKSKGCQEDLDKTMEKMKKTGKEAINQFKEMF